MPLGQLWKTTSPGGHSTTRTYSTWGSLIAIADGENRTTSLRHFLSGDLSSSTDGAGRVTSYTYDADGRTASVTVPGSTSGVAVTRYGYTGAGRIASVQPPLLSSGSLAWTYGYDLAGRLTSQSDPLLRTRSATYDLDGLVTKVATAIPGAAGAITYTRDALGRLTATNYGDGFPSTTYTYRMDGSPATVTDAQGVKTYGYDTVGRPASLSRSGAAWAWTWNPDGTLKTQTRPGTGQTETFTYDQMDRVASVAGPDGTTSFGYDADSNLASVMTPNGVVETSVYDNASVLATRTLAKGATTLASHAIARNGAGDPTQVLSTRAGASTTQSFVYDNTGRMQGVCYVPVASCTGVNAAQQWWTYDLDGNRRSEKNGVGNRSDHHVGGV